MVRRRYTLTATYGARLSNELDRIITWTIQNKRKRNVKQLALIKADRSMTKFCNLLIPYVYRTRVKRDLGRNAVDLSDAQKHKLCLDQKREQLKAFGGIIDDAIRS